MDWDAFALSLRLSAWTTLILFVVGLMISRSLAWRDFSGKALIEAVVALPLVLPPTVLGFYLLVALGRHSPLGQWFEAWSGHTLVFSFSGLLAASVVYSLPFTVQPMLRAFEAVPQTLREAAWCSGLNHWQTLVRVEFPLAWPGILSGLVLTFAHTMGEFGVVLMVGGNIPSETRTISIAIYDRTQAFDQAAAGTMSLVLLVFAFFTVSLVYAINQRHRNRH
ncbi:MAG: molybdate ABC transporter permease subunit [Pseudomonadota bacterium]